MTGGPADAGGTEPEGEPPGASAERGAERRVPLFEEVLSVDRRPVDAGQVRIRISVEERVEPVEMALRREEYDVTRVPIGRLVDTVPETRREGETLIVPVVEEEVVVTRRLVLREEIHLTRRAVERTERLSVKLRAERAEVTRDGPPSHPRNPEETGQ